MSEAKKCPCPLEGEVSIFQLNEKLFQVRCSKCVASVSHHTAEGAMSVWNRVSARTGNECCADEANVDTLLLSPLGDMAKKCRVCGSRLLPLGVQAGLVQGDQRKECCKEAENLTPVRLRDDLVVNVCKVCKCRHFELTVEPGKLGVQGAEIGG